MRLFFLSVFVLLGLTGCCVDCTNTKLEYDSAIEKVASLSAELQRNSSWINEKIIYFSAEEEKIRASQKAVFNARVCDYLVPTCPNSMTESGRALISEFGTKFDTSNIISRQIMKLIMLALGLASVTLLGAGVWLALITPRKESINALKAAIKASNQAVEASKQEANGIVAGAHENAAKAALKEMTNLQAAKKATKRELAYLEIIKTNRAEGEQASARLKAELATLDSSVRSMKAAQDAIKNAF
jgi:hypothetical protein